MTSAKGEVRVWEVWNYRLSVEHFPSIKIKPHLKLGTMCQCKARDTTSELKHVTLIGWFCTKTPFQLTHLWTQHKSKSAINKLLIHTSPLKVRKGRETTGSWAHRCCLLQFINICRHCLYIGRVVSLTAARGPNQKCSMCFSVWSFIKGFHTIRCFLMKLLLLETALWWQTSTRVWATQNALS